MFIILILLFAILLQNTLTRENYGEIILTQNRMSMRTTRASVGTYCWRIIITYTRARARCNLVLLLFRLIAVFVIIIVIRSFYIHIYTKSKVSADFKDYTDLQAQRAAKTIRFHE